METRLTVYRPFQICKSSKDAGSAGWQFSGRACERTITRAEGLSVKSIGMLCQLVGLGSDGCARINHSYRRYICKSNKDAVSASWPRSGRACESKM